MKNTVRVSHNNHLKEADGKDYIEAYDKYNQKWYHEMAKFYNIIQRTEWYVRLEACEDLSKLSDAFMTKEQMKLEGIFEYNDHYYFGGKIRMLLDEWVDLMQEGCASTRSTTPRIRAMISDYRIHTHLLNQCCPSGYMVSGDRIFNKSLQRVKDNERTERKNKVEQAQRQAQMDAPYIRNNHVDYHDIQILFAAMKSVIREATDVELRIFTYDLKSWTLCKKLCKWPVVKAHLKQTRDKKYQSQDLPFHELIWKDPEELNYHRNYK